MRSERGLISTSACLEMAYKAIQPRPKISYPRFQELDLSGVFHSANQSAREDRLRHARAVPQEILDLDEALGHPPERFNGHLGSVRGVQNPVAESRNRLADRTRQTERSPRSARTVSVRRQPTFAMILTAFAASISA